MNIELITLDSLRTKVQDTGKDEFVREYPGAFLLAMGLLAVEAIQARRRAAKNIAGNPKDATAAVSFGPRLRYDPLASHPLAGCAFFLRPTQEHGRVEIGRSQDSDITVPDPSVSERHCRIEVTDGGVIVIDLDSTNGTTVNLERIPKDASSVLADEDFLSVGRYSFQLLTAPTLFDELALLNTIDV